MPNSHIHIIRLNSNAVLFATVRKEIQYRTTACTHQCHYIFNNVKDKYVLFLPLQGIHKIKQTARNTGSYIKIVNYEYKKIRLSKEQCIHVKKDVIQ
jgi:uncharacterized protein YukJ